MIYNPEDQLLISGLKLSLLEEDIRAIEKCIPEIGEWKSLENIIIRNGIAPLVYKNLSSGINTDKISKETMPRLKQAYYKILGRNILLIEKFRAIHRLFSEQQIEVIALKGIHLSEAVYKDIGLRPMSDIDLLVHEEDAEKCRDLLIERGFTEAVNVPSDFIEKTEKHLSPLVQEGISVEIHVKLQNEQCGYSINTDDFWKNSWLISLHGTQVKTLCPNDLLLHLCIHLDSHNSDSDIQLRLYGDIVNVLDSYRDEIDWELFEESCKKSNCSGNVFKSLLLAKKYFNAAIPDAVIERNQHFFDKDAEDIFFMILRLDSEEILRKKRDFLAVRNIQNLKRVKGLRNKVTFLFGDMFPSKSFMYQNYRIKHKGWIYFYYLKRLCIGVYKLLLLARKKFLSKEKGLIY